VRASASTQLQKSYEAFAAVHDTKRQGAAAASHRFKSGHFASTARFVDRHLPGKAPFHVVGYCVCPLAEKTGTLTKAAHSLE